MMILSAISDAAKKTFVYSGRSERLEHWAFTFFTAWCGVIILVVNRYMGSINQFPINWIVLILGVWLALANVSLMVRRLHDHNLSGFFLFLPLLAFTVWIFGYDQFTNYDNPIIPQDNASLMMHIGKWSLVSTSTVFLSFFARAGGNDRNKYGIPV